MADVLIKLCGVWERTRRGNTEEGHFYLAGRLGNAKFLGFRKPQEAVQLLHHRALTAPAGTAAGGGSSAWPRELMRPHARSPTLRSQEQRDQHEHQRPPDEVPW